MLKKLLVFILISLVFLKFYPFAEAKDSWQKYQSAHFIVYHKGEPKDFVEEIAEAGETYYKKIARNLGFTRYKGWTWENKCKIYIYPDSQEYVSASNQAGWSHGAAWVKKRIIRTFPTAHGFFDSTLPHELGHIIFREFIGFKAYVPLWIEEGVAMNQERAKRVGAHKEVKKFLEAGSFIPLDQLTTMGLSSRTPKDLVSRYYTESASVVNYLINEHKQYKFSNFCNHLRDGRNFNNAFEKAYVQSRLKNVKDLNEAWVKYLKK